MKEKVDIYEDRLLWIRYHLFDEYLNATPSMVKFEGREVYSVVPQGFIVVTPSNPTSRRLYPWNTVVSFDAHSRDEIWHNIDPSKKPIFS